MKEWGKEIEFRGRGKDRKKSRNLRKSSGNKKRCKKFRKRERKRKLN